MMKELRILFVFSVVMAAVFFLSNTASAVRIKIATKVPENFKSAKIMSSMFREIKEKTNGNVVFKVYYGGVKGTGRDLLLKIKSGEIQGGEFTSGEAASVSKDLDLMSAPLTFKDYREVDYVFDRMSLHLSDELEKRGYVVLGWFEMGFAYIMSLEPIESLADLKDKKVWIPEGDNLGRAVFEEIGVPPIPLTIADVILALQTGQIDTVANSFVGAIALQWHTNIRYITDTPILYAYGLLMITREAYDKIPPMYRETVHEILDRYFDKLKKDIRSSNRESARALVSEGIRFVTAAPGDQEEFEGVVREVKDRLLEKEFPGEGLKKLREYIQEYRKTPSEGE
jgi:TRAP-type C4-dicarboxylate transport system substrate-binding protein